MSMRRVFGALLIGSTSYVISVGGAFAQPICQSGNITIVRTSKITPTGTLAGFQKAVSDHARWYAQHGYSQDEIYSAPVVIFDKTNGMAKISDDTVMTFHTHVKGVPANAEDDAWNAYVREYRENSSIVTETAVCMPK